MAEKVFVYILAVVALIAGLSGEASAGTNCGTLAFDGALGFGRYSAGGTGGPVFTVTDLRDYGYFDEPEAYSNTLRYYIEQIGGPRNIEFATGGTIPLKQNLVIDSSYVTIDGRTSDGSNITISPDSNYAYIGQTQIKNCH